MLDAIVTISESTPRAYVRECLRSVRAAAELAPYPVRIIETPGVPRHIGKAMLGGLAKSTADYVTWVDDDDFVLPNAFACLQRHFTAQPSAICAREIRLLANGYLQPNMQRHHLTAFRRDAISNVPFADLPCRLHAALLDAVPDAVDELSWVYCYRIRRSAGLELRRAHAPQ